MKKLSRLLIPAFAALVLTGCGKNDWFTLAPAAGGDTQQATSAQGGSQGASSSSQQGDSQASSSSQQGSSETSSSVAPSTSRTVLSIVNDVCTSIFGSAVKDVDYYDGEDADTYYTFVFSEKTTLQAAVEDLYEDLPSYLIADPDTPARAGTWEDNSDGYFAYYVDKDNNSLCVDLGSMEDDGDIVVQIDFYGMSYIDSAV